MFVFIVLYRSPPGLVFFSLFSWHSPVPVPPCLNNEPWERCWEEKQRGTESRGVRGSWLIQAPSGCRAHPGGVFTRNTPPANTSPMAGAASRGWQDIVHIFVFVLLLSLHDVSAFGQSGRRCWDMWASVLPRHGQ